MPLTNMMLPVFAQVLLTFVVLILMGRARGQSLRQNRTSMNARDVAFGDYQYNDAALKAANNFKNQFEMPVLFYAGIAFALILKQTDVVLLSLAWAFVLTRIVHAIIHLGPNVVSLRAPVYFIGVLVLLAFWIVLMVRVVGAASTS